MDHVAAGSQAAGDEGEGVGAANFHTAPRPSALMGRQARSRAVCMVEQDVLPTHSPLERLGYDQPRDSPVHGVALSSLAVWPAKYPSGPEAAVHVYFLGCHLR